MEPSLQASLLAMSDKPQGLLLATGPTGSGKTTTLCALASRLALQGRKIITIEDPVEYALPGAVQVQVNEAAGLGFAASWPACSARTRTPSWLARSATPRPPPWPFAPR
jgi:type II secretory ATPase GspE/PulE/Tfp pilus assembly ATPase PilB-like protein